MNPPRHLPAPEDPDNRLAPIPARGAAPAPYNQVEYAGEQADFNPSQGTLLE
jgi:hypothetical protein